MQKGPVSKYGPDENVTWETLNRTEVSTVAMWIEVIGTIISALGNTPALTFIGPQLASDLNLVGDTIQLGGTVIQVEDEKNLTYNKIGNIIQVAGNSEEIAGYAIPLNLTDLRTLLQTQGNAIQLTGISLSFIFTQVQPTLSSIEEAYGTMLQILGLGMQTLSGGFPSSNEFGQNLNTTGNWVQVIGAILQAIGQTRYLEKLRLRYLQEASVHTPTNPSVTRYYALSNANQNRK